MIGIGSVKGFLLKVQFSLKGQLCLNILLGITREYNQTMSVKCLNKHMFPFQGSERGSRRIRTSGGGLVDATEDMDKDWEEGHRGRRRERIKPGEEEEADQNVFLYLGPVESQYCMI